MWNLETVESRYIRRINCNIIHACMHKEGLRGVLRVWASWNTLAEEQMFRIVVGYREGLRISRQWLPMENTLKNSWK